MHIEPLVIIAALLLATTAFAGDVRVPNLPQTVIGAWAPSADACRHGFGAEAALARELTDLFGYIGGETGSLVGLEGRARCRGMFESGH